MAGVYGSIIIILLLIVYNTVNLLYLGQSISKYGYNYALKDPSPFYLLLTLSNYLLYLIDAVVFLAAGALAVRAAAPALKKLEDAAIVAAISGLVASLLYSLANVVVSAVVAYLSMDIALPIVPEITGNRDIPVNIDLSLISAVASGIISLICCMPVFLVAGAILALAGGLAYWMMFLNKGSAS